MKIDIDKKYSIPQLVEIAFLVFLPVICVFGVSFFPYTLRTPLIYLVGILSIICVLHPRSKIKIEGIVVLYFLFLVYVAVSLTYSYDKSSTLNLLLLYSCLFPLLLMDLSQDFCSKLIDIFMIVSVVIACSILISVPIENCMNRYFWFIVNPTRSTSVTLGISNELASGSYSGFAREKGDAAYIMNVGIASCLSRFFLKGKLNFKEVICLGIMLMGLLLTGKRMMLITLVIVFCFLILLVRMKGKAGKFILISAIIVTGVVVILCFIPSLANIFFRFADVENLESLGGRQIIWKYSYLIIEKYWLFGAGFGSFNEFAFDQGFTVYDEKWTYNAHNIYYQLLGELGIVGSLFLLGFLIVGFVMVARLVRNKELGSKEKKIVYFSFYIQLMLLLYGVTGNPIYTRQIAVMWVLSIAMIVPIYRRVSSKKLHIYQGKG